MRKIENVEQIKTHVPHGHGKGGQSQNRFQRLHEESMHEYLKRVAEMVKDYFARHPVEAICIGGPAHAKLDLINNYLPPELRGKIIYIADTGNGGELGLRDLLQKMSEDNVIENQALLAEKSRWSDFMGGLASGGKVEYGWDETMSSLEEGRAGEILASEALPVDKMKCIEDHAARQGCKITVFSTRTEEGMMLKDGFGGIACFLRW